MKRLSVLFWLLFIPYMVYAQDASLSFAPPASDYSMVFLANLFGVVDGVLSGTGSQIVGAIFSVFNSAVLALGGIIIMYTLIVATMNTAHEGQMLGQKWSSIWIPLRSTFGLALLMPQASGYCLMQIFVMWVVTQGVGAADKVWQAALSYLNRGGVIVQAQPNGGNALISQMNGTANAIPNGAYTILAGQVCMLSLQMLLETQRQLDIAKGGRCAAPNPNQASPGPLCNGEVPNFLNTVNFVSYQQAQPAGSAPYTMPLPYFSITSSNPEYAPLNGLCGSVTWNAMSAFSNATPQTGSTSSYNSITLNSSELEAAQLSRAIALQQMYMDLSIVAQIMVNNDPNINTANNTNSSSNENTSYSPAASQQYGVPYTVAGAYCNAYNDTCTTWGPYSLVSGTTNSSSTVLFNGTEFYGAINDYNAVMAPTLNLINEMAQGQQGNNARSFINQANTQGWIMAGAYFFNLVNLNGNAAPQGGTPQDTNSGLDKSTPVQLNNLDNTTLNSWLNNNTTAITNITQLFQGGFTANAQSASTSTSTPVTASAPNFQQAIITSNLTMDGGQNSSTVNGFVNNSLMIQLPGQPGIATLNFANAMSINAASQPYYLQKEDFNCGSVTTFVFTFCLGKMLGDVFYNGILVAVYNGLTAVFQSMVQQIVMAFLEIPLQGMSVIFQDGLSTLTKPGVNPVVALAQMGEQYINFSGNMWISLMMMAISAIIIPWFGIFIFPLFVFGLPLILSWVGVMVGIGFVTSYYVPVLPYMIFTFGAVAWLIAVIEAMVAAPLVALGITHPEGHDAFGKGEAAIMLLLNVFLRPAMMIIGYIFAISLSYVGIWIMNAGYDQAISYIQTGTIVTGSNSFSSGVVAFGNDVAKGFDTAGSAIDQGANVAGSAIDQGVNVAGSAIDQGVNVAGSAIDQGVNVAGSAIDQGVNTAGSAIDQGVNTAGSAINQGVNAAGSAIDQGVNAAGSAIEQGVTAVGNATGQNAIASQINQSVNNTTSGINQGVNTTTSGINQGANATASGINQGANATASGINQGANATASGINQGANATVSTTNQVNNAMNNASSSGSSSGTSSSSSNSTQGSGTGGYTDWAGIYAFFFSILIYTTMYLTLVQKSFTLISYLPDKVLRWIGGSPESLGAESAQWGDDQVKGNLKDASDKTTSGQGQMSKQMASGAQDQASGQLSGMVDKSGSGSVSAAGSNAEATPSAGGRGAAGAGGDVAGSSGGIATAAAAS